VVVVGSGCGGGRHTGCGGMRRDGGGGTKPTTWQRLNRRYSIWDAAGRAAAVGNIMPLCRCPRIAVVVQLVRALRDLSVCSGVQFPNNALFFSFIYYYYLLLNTIQCN
jgi:hypothetical protein